MNAGRLLPLTLSLLALASCASAGAAAPRVDEALPTVDPALRAEVVDTVQDMFDAMRTHDVETLRELVMPGAIIVPLNIRDGVVRHGLVTDGEFVAGTAGDGPTIDERFLAEPAVRVDGPLATVWAPYEVLVDGERLHCGTDAVQLARIDGRWRVTAITYTADPASCDDLASTAR